MKVAMLGLGAMGSRMAARAVEAGFDVVVWNRTPRSVDGATTAPTAQDAVAQADIAVTMLTDDDVSRQVWSQVLPSLRPGALAVESSTITPAWSRELSAKLQAAGARYLEAPVLGTRPHADQGILKVMVGGAEADLAYARTLFESWGTALHLGPVGAAMALKLAVNSMFATQVVLLSEALALAGAHDVSRERALTFLEKTPAFSPALAGVAALLRAGTDDPLFPVALVEKDLRYAAGQADLPLLEAARSRYAAAIDADLGGRNIHAVSRLYG